MKKCLCLIFAVLFFASALFPKKSAAYSAASYCVTDALTGRVLCAHNADERRGMASTTKIMTALVALENAMAADAATVSYNASRTEGSSLYLKVGEKMRISDLVYGLMLNSGNDAAVVLAEHIGGDIERFAEMMNETARKIGANSTHFTNPNGLYEEGHYTTARDLALIARYAMKNESFRQIVSTKKHTVKTIPTEGNAERSIYLLNHNKLLNMLEGCNGIKTGFTKKTGRCLVSSAKRNGVELICVTLNDGNDWNDHISLLENAFAEYQPTKAAVKGQCVGMISVENGAESEVGVVLAEDVYIPAKNGEKLDCEIVCRFDGTLKAPIEKGERVGEAEIIYNKERIATVELVAERAVGKKSKPHFWAYMKRVLAFALLGE